MAIRMVANVLDCVHIDPGHKLLLVCLADHANDDGVCWPSHDRLAHRIGRTRRTVIRMIHELEEQGFVRVNSGRGRSSTYHLSIPTCDTAMSHPPRVTCDTAMSHPEQENPAEMSHPPVTQPCHTTCDIAVTHEPSLTTKTISTTPYAMFAAVFGDNADALPERERGRQLAAAKRLVTDGLTDDDAKSCATWLRAQRWLTSGVDVLMVEKFYGRWIAAGRPATVGVGTIVTDSNPIRAMKLRMQAEGAP